MAYALVGPSLAVAGHAARALSAYRTLRNAPAEADALLSAMRALEGPMIAATALHARERTAGLFDGALAVARAALADAEALLAGSRPDGADEDETEDEGASGWQPWLERAFHGVRRKDALPKARAEIDNAARALSLAFAAASALFGPLAPVDPFAPFALEQPALECALDIATELEAGRRQRIVLGAGHVFALLGSALKKAPAAPAPRAWSAQGRHALLLEASSSRSAEGDGGWRLALHPLEREREDDADGADDEDDDDDGRAERAGEPRAGEEGTLDGSAGLALLRALGAEPLVVLPLRPRALRVRRRPFGLASLPTHGAARAMPAALAAATPTYTFETPADGGGPVGSAGGSASRGRAGGSASAFALVFETISPPTGVASDGAERALGMRWPFLGSGWVSAEAVDALLAIGLARGASGSVGVDLESADGRRDFAAALRAIGDYAPSAEEEAARARSAALAARAQSPRTPMRASSPSSSSCSGAQQVGARGTPSARKAHGVASGAAAAAGSAETPPGSEHKALRSRTRAGPGPPPTESDESRLGEQLGAVRLG